MCVCVCVCGRDVLCREVKMRYRCDSYRSAASVGKDV